MALRVVDDPDASAFGDHPLQMLRAIGGPFAFRLPGHDRTRCRVLVTLLHGNEPSGAVALHRWLVSGRRPAVDILAIVPSVAAATAGAGFLHRMLPGQPDLNRSFVPPVDGLIGQLAKEVVRLIRASGATQVIDLHNNTGHSPAYGVVSRCDHQHLGLVSLFAKRCVISRLQLGTLVEALEDLTAVTVECGRSGDPAADDVAFRGLCAYFEQPELRDPSPSEPVQLYEMPLRMRISRCASIAFGSSRNHEADLTLRSDLDQHNFEPIPNGTAIGWSETLEPLSVTDEEGRDATADFFQVDAGSLRVRRTIVPIMMTTSVTAAQQDCLCYFVREAKSGG